LDSEDLETEARKNWGGRDEGRKMKEEEGRKEGR
jgi:hypothetical protein